MKQLHVHMVSDATGDTVRSVARACLVQFAEVETTEHVWVLVRTKRQLEKVIAGVRANPGIVMCTLVSDDLQEQLGKACQRLNVPCIHVLEPVTAVLGSYLGAASRQQPGRQHALDDEYFGRIEAMNFVLSHDDGQASRHLDDADVVLVGVSRTSKTPTSVYLANRGVKTANVPIIPDLPLPDELFQATRPLIVGLTLDPTRLVQIRRNRLLMFQETRSSDYTDLETIRKEITMARRLFDKQGWPVIDVTRRSIEETAAAIMQLHARRQGLDA
jgi:regulator of PEP synthase PpsR (kinase-PPPase family)